jgi:hypothetical protein
MEYAKIVNSRETMLEIQSSINKQHGIDNCKLYDSEGGQSHGFVVYCKDKRYFCIDVIPGVPFIAIDISDISAEDDYGHMYVIPYTGLCKNLAGSYER